jgi:hypothetical protein
LGVLVEARLLVAGTYRDLDGRDVVYVEAAHDALIRNWPRVATWFEQGANARALIREVGPQIVSWDQHARANNYSWQADPRLGALAALADSEKSPLNARELEFTRRSVRRRRIRLAQRWAIVVLVFATVSALGWRASDEADAALAAAGRAQSERDNATHLLENLLGTFASKLTINTDLETLADEVDDYRLKRNPWFMPFAHDDRLLAALAEMRRGQAHDIEGDVVSAADSYRFVLDVALPEHTDDIKLLNVRALAMRHTCEIAGGRGQVKEWLAECQDAAALQEQLLRIEPRLDADVGTMLETFGDTLLIAGRERDADKMFRRALAWFEKNGQELDAAAVHDRFGDGLLHADTPDIRGGLAEFRQALSEREAANTKKTSPEMMFALAHSHGNVGEALAMLQDPSVVDEARNEFQTSLRLARELIKLDPKNVDWRRPEWVALNDEVMIAPNKQQALELSRQAAAAAKATAQIAPESLDVQLDYAVSLDNEISCAIDAGAEDQTPLLIDEALHSLAPFEQKASTHLPLAQRLFMLESEALERAKHVHASDVSAHEVRVARLKSYVDTLKAQQQQE